MAEEIITSTNAETATDHEYNASENTGDSIITNGFNEFLLVARYFILIQVRI